MLKLPQKGKRAEDTALLNQRPVNSNLILMNKIHEDHVKGPSATCSLNDHLIIVVYN